MMQVGLIRAAGLHHTAQTPTRLNTTPSEGKTGATAVALHSRARPVEPHAKRFVPGTLTTALPGQVRGTRRGTRASRRGFAVQWTVPSARPRVFVFIQVDWP